jgi:hypothetical protein
VRQKESEQFWAGLASRLKRHFRQTHMKNRLDFIKTTVVGGIVFLIPAVIVVIALGKLFGAF